jgi:hypothetical protein
LNVIAGNKNKFPPTGRLSHRAAEHERCFQGLLQRAKPTLRVDDRHGGRYLPRSTASLGRHRGGERAILTIDAPLGTADRVLALLDHSPAVGTPVMLGGYSQDHRYVLTADSSCRVLAVTTDMAGRPLFKHNCTATRGVSGAPVLSEENGRWRTAGIDVLARKGDAGGYAVLLDAVRQQLQ